MSLFTRDITAPVTDMVIAIDSWRSQADTDRVVAEVFKAAAGIAINRVQFSTMIHKLLRCGRPDKARRLATCFDDREWRPWVILLMRAAVLCAVLAVPAAIAVVAIRCVVAP